MGDMAVQAGSQICAQDRSQTSPGRWGRLMANSLVRVARQKKTQQDELRKRGNDLNLGKGEPVLQSVSWPPAVVGLCCVLQELSLGH